MNVKEPLIFVKLALDLVMVLLFIAALGFRSTGGLSHEWIGLMFFILCALHVTLNWNWYGGLLMGKYSARRVLNTSLNLLILVGVMVLSISGVINSRHIFNALNLNGSLEMRQIHSLASYWGILLLGIHAGLQWNKVLMALKIKAGTNWKWLGNSLALRGLAILVTVYGIWASFDRDMASKLFLGFSFDFWDSSRPEILFYTHNLAIVTLYIVITHHSLKLIRRIHASQTY